MPGEREFKRALLAERLGYTEQPGAAFGSADVMPVASEFERRASVREASVRSDVVVPLCQSLVSGVLAGSLAGVALGSWEGGAIGAVCITSGVWLWQMLEHNSQLWTSERWLDAHAEEQPQQPERLVRIEVASDDAKHLRWLDLPIEERKLRAVAQGILGRGLSLSRPGLCGAGLLTQGEYSKLVAALLEAGLAVEVAGNRRELTASGRAMMRELLGGE